ncbi:MAG: D-hexose-6-phosphate mutarotase [Deltaproteobacteria bacterium]|nr:D-hexose-6-phosphate mutarotase [Deltaproteobacteria bacterium]
MTSSHLGVQELNSRYGIEGKVHFAAGKGGLVSVLVKNRYASACIFLQGAHVTHFQPEGQQPVLWLSNRSAYQEGKAIRGGIPLCWPWFGDHPDDPTKPAHGFVRTSLWEVLETWETADGVTLVRLRLEDDEASRRIWPNSFQLELRVLVGRSLVVALVARNTGKTPFPCGGALHSYFLVGAVESIEIFGLDGCDYLDKIDHFSRGRQGGTVRLAGETDRIYVNTADVCTIKDPVLSRYVTVAKKGSNSTVIWNPGPRKSATMPDMDRNGYRQMVCVETANAADDTILLPPGGMHILQAEISPYPK